MINPVENDVTERCSPFVGNKRKENKVDTTDKKQLIL